MVPTTIVRLRSLHPPATLPRTNRVRPVETTVWSVDAVLLRYKVEEDSDIHVVLADQILGERRVAPAEGLLGLDDLDARVPAHLVDLGEHVAVARGVVPLEREQLADVHALVAHALDVADHVEDRGDDPQVGCNRRLQSEQCEHALVHLEVAAVEPVVVGDDQSGELDVLVLNGLERAVERRDDDVEAPKRLRLERFELLPEPLARLRP